MNSFDPTFGDVTANDSRTDSPTGERPTTDIPATQRPSADVPTPNKSSGGRVGECTRTGRTPTFPEDVIHVSAWPDPVLDRLGHDPRSGYVERYWLSILGPSCLLLLRRIASELERHPDGFELDTVQWAMELGLGMRGGRNGPFWRSIERGCRFGAAQRNGGLLAVRRRLPPLTVRQVERLPVTLQGPHQEWTEARLAKPRRATVTKWSASRSPATPDEQHLNDAA